MQRINRGTHVFFLKEKETLGYNGSEGRTGRRNLFIHSVMESASVVAERSKAVSKTEFFAVREKIKLNLIVKNEVKAAVHVF